MKNDSLFQGGKLDGARGRVNRLTGQGIATMMMYHGTHIPQRRMTDDDLIQHFEDLTLDPTAFHHTEHVRLAFAYLTRYDLFAALERYRAGLKRLAAHHGAPRKYHETVTCGLMVLIHERMVTRPGSDSWEGFVESNPDMLRWLDGAFFDYYPREVLSSDLARTTFVLPHLEPTV